MREDSSQIINRPCSWRATAETPTFWIVDARALLPFLLFIFHMRLWTLYVAIVTTAAFSVLRIWRITPIEASKAALFYLVSIGYRYGHIGHRRGIENDYE